MIERRAFVYNFVCILADFILLSCFCVRWSDDLSNAFLLLLSLCLLLSLSLLLLSLLDVDVPSLQAQVMMMMMMMVFVGATTEARQ